MATADDKKKIRDSSSEEEPNRSKEDSAKGKAKEDKVLPQHPGSSADEQPAKASPKKRKQSAAVDLSSVASSHP